ncbi:exonuclease SbcCD subunit D C-terminal domain-containing protein [Serratia microhaemolytica]|uniref:exonuclease SbcCD subunit D C-terminal domain-containing protein n=1 Tax=Serratia microhaemolytica TaxID=2675110 RepID=UPI0019808DAC|nr:exonuclease SbcCD subunit D C-terminal domain-containing protein [Serratia microhaemolytica]
MPVAATTAVDVLCCHRFPLIEQRLMKILHTSDWHLGRLLYGRQRYSEFAAFLDWLLQVIEQQQIEVLLVAGDVFDTTTPSHRAQQLYYHFLQRVAASCCQHVIITAGNHDSPTFLAAPRALLRQLNIHVVASVSDDLADEVLLLRDRHGNPQLIVCAVPYLRDRDIRQVDAGESISDKEQKLIEGIRVHYAAVAERAEQMRQSLSAAIPIVALGHLFAAGGQISDGDGVRDLYVGSLAHVSAAIFPPCFDYVALGHLHVPQQVAGLESVRYSGSPLPMGFGEAKQQKSLCLVECVAGKCLVSLIKVPLWQSLARIEGDWPQIEQQIGELAAAGSQSWLEIVYRGEALISDLRERLAAITPPSLTLLRIKNSRIIEQLLTRSDSEETLDDLSHQQVFERCLQAHEIPPHQWPELIASYQQVVQSLDEEDRQAE